MGEAPPIGEERPRLRWWTCVVAALWVGLPIAMALAAQAVREMLEEMGSLSQLPLLSQVVVGIPGGPFLVLGLLVAGALVWKSRAVPARTSAWIDVTAAVTLLLLTVVVLIGLLGPLLEIPVTYGRP